MKHLLALITCHTRMAYAYAQRETWIPKIPSGLDYRFFLGPSDRAPRPDEVFLDCDDSYTGLPSKIRSMCRWAVDNGYDSGTKVDDDVILKPVEWFNAGIHKRDFSGHSNWDKASILIPWGFCYTMSQRSMDLVAQADLPKNNNDEAWIANLLVSHGVRLHHEPRYQLYMGRRSDFITPTKRPLRAPKRMSPVTEHELRRDALAICMYIQWFGFHAIPDEMNIRAFNKVFKETQ